MGDLLLNSRPLKEGHLHGDIDKKCNKAIRGLCEGGERWSEVLQAYRDFQAAGARVDSASYRLLMSAALQAGACLDVVDLLAEREAALGPPAVSAYCALVSRLLKLPGRGTPAKQAALAVWRALRASGQRLDAPAFRTGMNLMVELGRHREAAALLEGMRAAGHRPGYGAYHILIKQHAQRGDMEAARKLFAQLRAYRGHKPLVISAYNTLLSGFVRLGDLTMARAVLDKARREGARPDAWSYSTFASGLVAAGRLDEAEALLGEMAAGGLPPCEVVYGALLHGSARLNDWPRAERLLSRMRSEGVRLNAVHFNILIRGRTYTPGYGAAPQPAAVAAAASTPPAAPALTPAAPTAMAVDPGHVSTAATSTAAAAAGIPAAGPGGAATAPAASAARPNGSAAALPQQQQAAAAAPLRLTRPLPPPSLVPPPARASGARTAAAINGSANGAAASSAVAATTSTAAAGASSFEVESLLAEMRASGLRPDAATYGTLIHAAVRAGSVEAALEVLGAMRVDGVAPDGAVFTSLMKLFRQQGEQAQALEFFSQLSASRSSAVDCWALNCLVALHASAGRLAEAAEAAARADAHAAEAGRPPPPEATYALIQGYGQQRQLGPALAAFRRFLATGGRPHRKMCEYVYRLCLAHFDFGAAGQVLRAMRLMRGLALREELYRELWEDAQRRLQGRRQGGNGGMSRPGSRAASLNGSMSDGEGGANPLDTEKLKWWFGLPNRYYESEWR
ncbi:hypothetical protein GPECTOR_3g177 [Gonium pectorale]|uniref:Pentacotripeptide-repeat region of PRORP domain-containing protein n=1 Tax=Gonium pectorale TaxID=33097 RepID=A0A150GZ03_GONPE|nr:hypothetical protein GPECTOR_3g177 [Gonium pectorale]|eukprot:KXZ55014.1 hypothetical protein GPECTOR_3g177 [Gonium pectorale]